MSGSPPISRPRCPRCGYDLSGAADAWRDACPLEGVCSECGLAYRWRDVLNPAFTMPGWLIENPNTRKRRGLPGTSVRVFRPRRFWSVVWMTHPFAPAQVGLFTAVWFVALIALLQAVMTPAVARWNAVAKVASFRGRSPLSTRVDPIGFVAECFGRPGAYLWLVLLWWVMMPLGLLALVHTRRVAKVRAAHLGRIWAYALPWVVMLATLSVGLRALSYWRNPMRTRFSWGWGGASIPQWELDAWAVFDKWEPLASVVIGVLLLGWFWYAAARRYLRLPQPGAAVGIMLVISGLAALAIVEWSTSSQLMTDFALHFSRWWR